MSEQNMFGKKTLRYDQQNQKQEKCLSSIQKRMGDPFPKTANPDKEKFLKTGKEQEVWTKVYLYVCMSVSVSVYACFGEGQECVV